MAADGLFEVNWKNPMLLGERHLRVADRLAARARSWLARASAPAVGGYGLVPPAYGGGQGLQMTYEHGADRLTVTIHALSALAPDGTPLVFNETVFPQLQGVLRIMTSLERNIPGLLRLGLLVEPLDTTSEGAGSDIEVGEPDAAEDPPRHPLRWPALQVSIVPDALSSGSSLKVAEFLWDGATIIPAEDYYPPCLTVTAWPVLARRVTALRQDLKGLRSILHGAADCSDDSTDRSLIQPVALPLLMAIAGLEDSLPGTDPRIHPHVAWETAMRALRVTRTAVFARREAHDSALKDLIQPGNLSSRNTHFFEDLDGFLDKPYCHEQLGPALRTAHDLLVGMREVLAHLSNRAHEDTKVSPPEDSRVYIYRDKRYRLADCAIRQFTIDDQGVWHFCHFLEMNLHGPKSLLLVCDRALLVDMPRGNAGLWMLDRFENIPGRMFAVSVDSASDRNKIVAHFPHIGEPTVNVVSVAHRGMLNLSSLAREPDEQLRIYFEE